MPRIEIAGTVLSNTDVERVSLVKRGANRIPFRITKSEESDMIDLASVGQKMFKSETKPPQLLAVMLAKGADERIAAALIQKAGLETKSFHKTEDEHAQHFKLPDADLSDAGVLKISDNAALVVGGLKKAFNGYDFSSTSFSDVMKSGAFYPSVCNALDMFRETVINIMGDSDSPVEMSQAIAKSGDELKSYLATLTQALPVQAFKAEVAVVKGLVPDLVPEDQRMENNQRKPDVPGNGGPGQDLTVRKDEKKPEPTGSEGAVQKQEPADISFDDLAKFTVAGRSLTEIVDSVKKADAAKNNIAEGDPKDKKDKDKKDPAKKEEISASPVFGNATQKPQWGSKSNDIEGSPVAGNETGKWQQGATSNDIEGSNTQTRNWLPPGGPAGLSKADVDSLLVALKASVSESLQATSVDLLKEVDKRMNALGGRIEGVETLARKADEAMRGTVHVETPWDRVHSQKSEAEGAPPLLDTAFSRRDAA